MQDKSDIFLDRRKVSIDVGDKNRRTEEDEAIFDATPWWLKVNYLCEE